MTQIEKILSEIKTQLKASITSEKTPEEVKDIAALDSKLDEVQKEYDSLSKKYDDLKEVYIEQVKNTGFKPSTSDGNDGDPNGNKTMDEIMQEELDKIEKEKK